MIATIETSHSLITGPPGLRKFDKEGIAYTVIQNSSPHGLKEMGYAEHNTEKEKSEKLDNRCVSNFSKLNEHE
jgi:hypothetical protein